MYKNDVNHLNNSRRSVAELSAALYRAIRSCQRTLGKPATALQIWHRSGFAVVYRKVSLGPEP